MSQALSSLGVQFKRLGVAIAEVVNLTPPNWKSETIDVTNHDSIGRMAEFIGGLRSSDDAKIDGNFILADAGQAGLLADQADGLVHVYQVVFPTAWGASFDFSAVVTEFKVSDFKVKGDALTFSCVLKISGAVTLNKTMSAGLTTPFFVLTPPGTNTPAPSGSVYEYVNNALTATPSVTVTPTASAGQVITVNGNVVATGVPSSAIALGVAGSVTNVLVVVQETGKVSKTYEIHVARA